MRYHEIFYICIQTYTVYVDSDWLFLVDRYDGYQIMYVLRLDEHKAAATAIQTYWRSYTIRCLRILPTMDIVYYRVFTLIDADEDTFNIGTISI